MGEGAGEEEEGDEELDVEDAATAELSSAATEASASSAEAQELGARASRSCFSHSEPGSAAASAKDRAATIEGGERKRLEEEEEASPLSSRDSSRVPKALTVRACSFS